MKTIYLASPYGFSDSWKHALLPPIIVRLEALGLEVWEPFERNDQQHLSGPGWGYRIGQRDVADVRESDAIFAVVNGLPPDEGVMVELGIAIALGHPIFLFRDDFRRMTDCEDYPLNLMVFAGLPEQGWQDYLYTSLEDITDPTRPLAKWAELQGKARCGEQGSE